MSKSKSHPCTHPRTAVTYFMVDEVFTFSCKKCGSTFVDHKKDEEDIPMETTDVIAKEELDAPDTPEGNIDETLEVVLAEVIVPGASK